MSKDTTIMALQQSAKEIRSQLEKDPVFLINHSCGGTGMTLSISKVGPCTKQATRMLIYIASSLVYIVQPQLIMNNVWLSLFI